MKDIAVSFLDWLKGRKFRHIPILLYHRVADLDIDPQLLSVSLENFEQQMTILKENFRVIPLRELRTRYENRLLEPADIVITFDDGYADNILNAKPILDRFNLPATIFVTTDYLANPREFWWDELERILLLPGDLPEKLSLETDKKTFHWNLEHDQSLSLRDFTQHHSWDVSQIEFPTIRHKIYAELCEVLRPLHENQRKTALSFLRSWAGKSEETRATHRPILSQEISSIHSDEGITIAAHATTHSVLSQLSNDEQFTEIKKSKSYLEGLLQRPVDCFAYPYGTKSDYDVETVQLVKKAGFNIACSNFEPDSSSTFDPYQLPRFIVRNWNTAEFKLNLLSRIT